MYASTVPSTLLSARGLACGRGARCLFDHLDIDVRAGELLWVRGRNGRGKTSLLRLLAGVATPAAGDVRRAARGVSFVGHADALKDDLSVAEALAYLLRIHGHAGDDRTVEGALAHWGLLERRDVPVRTLSTGLRRRVALARLSVNPSAAIWILDEPYDSLDADGVERLNAQLARQLAAGGAVLFTGHEPRLVPGLPLRTLDLDAHPSRTIVPDDAFEHEPFVLRQAGRKLQLHGT